MARVLPTAIQDETGRNARQNAAMAAALKRLYISLQARREEQERNEAMRLHMLNLQQQHAIGMQERQQQHQYDLEDYRYGGGAGGTGGPNLLGPGVQGLPPPAAAKPTTAAPAARPPVFTPNMIPGSVAPLTPGDQFKGAQQQQPPIGPNPDKFSALDTEAFSAQSKPTAPPPGKGGMSVQSPLPKETSRRTRQRPQRDAYLPIDPQWQSYMTQKEKEYGLPQGMLMTLYGMENGGGRVTGKNPKSSAYGLFQFTADLRKEHGISDQDALNPAIMIDKAAANLQRNHEVLKQKFGVSLPTTPEAIPVWSILHQFGSGNGPRIVKALADGHDTPMMQVMLPSKNNYQTLVNNGIDPMTSVKNFVGQHAQKARNWFHSSIQQFQNPDRQQQDTQQVQRPPADIQGGGRGANPRLIRAISGGASLALPDGYSLRQTSGHRPGDRGYHGRREAADFQIVTPDGKAIPNRGEDTTGLYTRLARGVKTWVAENDPQLRINYGGAHGTRKGGGGVPDLMHYDTGPDRGNMRPDVRMSRLPLLSDEERNAPVQQASMQASAQARTPTPQVQALPNVQAQAQAPDASVTAATLPSRSGKWIGANAPYNVPKQESIAPLDIFSPTLAGNQSFAPISVPSKPEQQMPPTPITPQSSTLSARSDLNYGEQPTAPAPIVPQESTLSARSDLDYGAQAPEQVPQQKLPPPSEDYDLRDDMQSEFTVSSREGSPQVDVAVDQALADLRGDINTRNFPTLPTPGVVAKQELPPELTPPARPIVWPQQQPSPTAVARLPVPQEFATVDRGQRPAATPPDVSASTAQPIAPTRVPGQSIVNAIYSRLPNLSTAEQQGDRGTPPQLPNMPPPAALMPSLPPIPQGLSLEGVGEWLKQNFGPQGAPPAQQEFNKKLQDAVQQKFGDVRGAVSGFDPMAFIERLRYGPKSVKTTTIGPPQQPTAGKQPARTMPGGTPYIPDQPPLTLVPKKGGPANTTLSGGGSSASTVPLPGSGGVGIKQMPDGSTLVKMPDGSMMRRRVVNGQVILDVPNDTPTGEEVTAGQ